MNRARQISIFKRGLYLQAAVSLLLFLVLSAPHRVHHSFDQFTAPQSTELAGASVHDHGDNHADNSSVPTPASQQSDCVILTATQNAHALAGAFFDLTISTAPVEHTQKDSTHFALSFNASPCSQRAPPIV